MRTTDLVSNSDAVEFLRDLETKSVDLMLTDPPYGVLKNEDWDKPLSDQKKIEFISECSRVVRGAFFMFCSIQDVPRWIELLHESDFQHIRCGVWLKSVATWNSHPYPSNAMEYWVFADKVPGWKGRKTLLPIYVASPTARPLDFETSLHPARKPISLLRTIIHNHSNEGDLVVDPFAGSGAVGISALLENRKTLINDLDPVFVDLLHERLPLFQQFEGRKKLEDFMAAKNTKKQEESAKGNKGKGGRRKATPFTVDQQLKLGKLIFDYSTASDVEKEKMTHAWFLTQCRGDKAAGIPGFLGPRTPEAKIWAKAAALCNQLKKKKYKDLDGKAINFTVPKQTKAQELDSGLERLARAYMGPGGKIQDNTKGGAALQAAARHLGEAADKARDQQGLFGKKKA